MLNPVFFWIVAGLIVLASLLVVSSRNLVHGAIAMVAAFLVTAVLYVGLQAPFLAAVQVIVYAGAIMVLFVFVVMLVGRHEVGFDEPLLGQRPIALAGLAALIALLGWASASATAGTPAHGLAESAASGIGSPAAIGDRLYRDWILPFEVVSLLLLSAIVGVVAIARTPRSSGPARSDEGASDGNGAAVGGGPGDDAGKTG